MPELTVLRSQRQASLSFDEPALSLGEVVGVAFDPDEPEALKRGSLAGAAAAHKGIQHQAAGWCDETTKVAHQVGWLDGGVLVAFAAILAAGLGAVEKPRSTACLLLVASDLLVTTGGIADIVFTLGVRLLSNLLSSRNSASHV